MFNHKRGPTAKIIMSTKTASDRPARSLRKRQPSKLVDDIDVDLETLLQEHEEKGIDQRAQRDAKKQKKTATSEEDEKYADALRGYRV